MPTPTPLKVVFVLWRGERDGGSENLLWTFLRHVDRDAVAPECVFLVDGDLPADGGFPADTARIGIPTTVIPITRLRRVARTVADVVRLSRLLRKARPDVIVSWLETAQTYGGPAALLAGLRRRNGWWAHELPDRREYRLASILPTAAVGACSRTVAEMQAARWPRRRVVTVRPGIDPPEAAPPERLEALRAELGLPPGVPVVGIVGRLIPWKGQREFIEALARLRDSGTPAHGLVVGGETGWVVPGYVSGLHDLAARLGVSEHVTFTGQVPDAGPHLQLMDVCVNACEREAFGVVVLEAMSLGVPVVAVDAPGPREILEPERSGLLVDGADPGEIAASVSRVLGDPELRERLSTGGRERYRSTFTAQDMTGELARRLPEIPRA